MIHKLNNYLNRFLYRKAVYLLQKYGIMLIILSLSTSAAAQPVRNLSLKETIDLGLQNSRTLKLSQSKIDLAINQYKQVEEKSLPTASANLMYNHAEFLNSGFKLPGSNKAMELPSSANAYIGGVAIQQLIFDGNKLKYAKESTNLLTRIARLDAEKDSADIIYDIIKVYYNLYRMQQTREVVKQNLVSTEGQLQQSQHFFDQGIVTKNDVLRYQLQKSNIELTLLDLESNVKVINYNLNVLLGLPENTIIHVNAPSETSPGQPLTAYVDTALLSRIELQSLDLSYQAAASNVNSVKSDLFPTIGIGGNLYYINPSGKIIPPAASFLAPVTVAASVSWNIDKLWTNKTRVTEARIKQEEITVNKAIASDNIKQEVNKSYQDYMRSLQRIEIIQTSVDQARENNRIMESKYRNNIASVIDRIDAETQLFQTLINLELAKADAGLAYYTLIKSTGNITALN